jgi:hypothetical protein
LLAETDGNLRAQLQSDVALAVGVSRIIPRQNSDVQCPGSFERQRMVVKEPVNPAPR